MNSYNSHSSRNYQFSSGSGQPQSTTTETRTVIDADGTRRTETKTYSSDTPGGSITFDGGDKTRSGFTSQIGDFGSKVGGWMQDKVDNIGNKMHDIHIGAKISPRKSKKTEARFKRGWSSKRKDDVSSVLPVHPDGKSYEEIKSQCLRENKLFQDPDFPAVDSSIFFSRMPPRPFEWKRPSEIVDNPKLFVGGASRFDVKQGELGDCWLLAAVASLTTNQKLLFQIVPQDQGFEAGEYCGAFHFRFWRFGKWEDVIIDDLLPTYYNKLVYMHSGDNNEFWTALIEKAYAKLHGSYESLKGGATCEALEDFTGGVTEMYDFRQDMPKDMFQIMMKAHERSSLMGCSIEAMPGQLEAELANGLIMGHAYSITDVRMVNIKTTRMQGKIPLVRVRNPWGNECEWKGAWSDKSQEWKFISEAERQEMGLNFSHDGEFWMAFADFSKNFQKLEICHLGVEGMDSKQKGSWSAMTLDGSWKKRVNAGGCRNFLDTFWTNPQYRVEVADADEDDDEQMGTIIVGLMQKNRRKLRKEGLDMLTQGYCIYKSKDPQDTSPLDMRFFKYNGSIAKSPSFINMREITGRHRLEPGTYVIIPSTFEPNQEGDFLIRIFSEGPSKTQEMDEETGMSDVQPGVSSRSSSSGDSSDSRTERHSSRPHRVVDVEDKDSGRPETQLVVSCQRVTEGELEPAPSVEMTAEDKQQEGTIRAAFKRVSGEDLEVDAYELMDILNAAFMREFNFDGFTAETCRSMVAMMDEDQSGKLGFEEFKKLWSDLRVWKSMFKKFDKDKSGNLNSYELRAAFHSVGFKVSNGTFNGLVQRYSHRDGKIHFDDFIHCVVRMKTMFDTFKEMQVNGGKAEFSMDEFIQTTMYS